ncbi:MAG: tol-pal system YbgF family protein, partial [Sandaracinaceae bacterium]
AAAAAAPHNEATAEAPSVAPAPSARRSAASAASWFARANEARRDRRYEDAADAYRTLLARYPGSREAEVAQLLLGRVLLVNLADARGALERFDAYLAHQPGGTLAPEARTGRARALESLGRSEEARAAWQEILDRHPASPHAALARRRVR